MAINIHVPESLHLKPVITVFGIGGAGGNAINNMIRSSLHGIKFVAANTDAQALTNSLAENKIQLGEKLTRGLGAGANPQIGSAAAEETINEISDYLVDCNMVFITAGMGGGTGTGAAPIIAKIAREKNILTIGVVTKPFMFEGAHRMRVAEQGIEELARHVNTLIVIPNQNLFKIANENTTFADAFRLADNVLYSGVRGITDLMIQPGLVNLDFADIKTAMNEMGKAMMGTGEAEGEDRAIKAAEAAISNPLLEQSSMKGARSLLINITGGSDMTLFEVDEAANRVREEIDNKDANIIFGSTFSDELNGKIRVSVVATGIDAGHLSSKKVLSINNSIRYEQKVEEESNEDIPLIDDADPSVSIDDINYSDTTKSEDASYTAPQQKTGYFSGLFKKMLGKNDEVQDKLDLEELEDIDCDQEFLEKDIYDKPAFLRKKESTSK